MSKKQVKSMRGVIVDMDALRAANEKTVAVGNAKMNARGDIMGHNGTIAVPREEIIRQVYNNSAQSQNVSLKPAVTDTWETPETAVKKLTPKSKIVKTDEE